MALRFICSNPDISVLIPGMADPKELEQNLEAVNDDSVLSDAELAQIDTIRKELGTQFCRRCNYCAPCTAGISISSVFLFDGYFSRYGLADWAKERYCSMPKTASDCIGCGVCETRCPYELPIRQMLATAASHFGK